MPTALNVKIEITKAGGEPIDGFPFSRRIVVDEIQAFRYEKANDGDSITFTSIPSDQLSEIQLLALRSDQPITLRLDNQVDAGIFINANGLVLLLNVDLDAGASTNARLNSNGAVAVVKGFAGGT